MTFESPTPQTNRRAFIWRPGCKRLVPERPVRKPENQTAEFAFVAQGIINRNPKKH